MAWYRCMPHYGAAAYFEKVKAQSGTVTLYDNMGSTNKTFRILKITAAQLAEKGIIPAIVNAIPQSSRGLYATTIWNAGVTAESIGWYNVASGAAATSGYLDLSHATNKGKIYCDSKNGLLIPITTAAAADLEWLIEIQGNHI